MDYVLVHMQAVFYLRIKTESLELEYFTILTVVIIKQKLQ